MAIFPWEQAGPPISYEKCPHCGTEQPLEGKKVLLCTKSQQAELEARERQAAWARDQVAQQQGRKAKI